MSEQPYRTAAGGDKVELEDQITRAIIEKAPDLDGLLSIEWEQSPPACRVEGPLGKVIVKGESQLSHQDAVRSAVQQLSHKTKAGLNYAGFGRLWEIRDLSGDVDEVASVLDRLSMDGYRVVEILPKGEGCRVFAVVADQETRALAWKPSRP